MKTYVLERKQVVRASLEDVFGFFKCPENLARITPESLGFRILTPSPVKMEKGTPIDYTIRLLGIPVRWTTLITDYRPPFFFADSQIRGPYARWDHTHTFQAVPEGVLMTDQVLYSIPLGLLGRLANTLFVKKKLEHIFNHRAEMVARLFPA